jgi:hypothetical protein
LAEIQNRITPGLWGSPGEYDLYIGQSQCWLVDDDTWVASGRVRENHLPGSFASAPMLDALIGHQVDENRNYKGERKMPYRVVRFHFRAFLFAMSNHGVASEGILGENILHNLAMDIG